MKAALEPGDGQRLEDWRCMLEKACIAVNGQLRVVLMRAQKKRATERDSMSQRIPK